MENPFLKRIEPHLDRMRRVTAAETTPPDALPKMEGSSVTATGLQVEDEIRTATAETIEKIAGSTPAEREGFARELAHDLGSSGKSPEEIETDFEEFASEASSPERVAALAAAGNTIARVAQGRLGKALQETIETHAKRIGELEGTRKFGVLADMRRAPLRSLSEFGVRGGIELGIAYIAYRSAENAVFLSLSQMDATSTMSADWRRTIAVIAAAVASYSAFRFRHDIYTGAQDWGVNGSPLRQFVSPQNIARTGFRAASAGVVAFGGALAISKTVNFSHKMSGYGTESRNAIRPVSDSLSRGADIMSAFFTDLEDKQNAIVQTEIGAVSGKKGAGKSGGKGYGIKAAHKDYLFNGTYDNNQYKKPLDQGLLTFRADTLGIPAGTSVIDHVKQIWEQSGFEAQREKAKYEIDVLNKLLEQEQGESFESRLVKTTLKQVDDPTRIPKQVELALTEIKRLVDIHHSFKERVDGIFAKINATGLNLAKAGSEGIDVHAPDFTIDVTPLGQLPSAPGTSETAITLSDADLKNVVEFFEKQPGMQWFGEFIKDDDPSNTRTKLILSFMGLYFGIENLANLAFALRERHRRRRERKEMPEMIRDIYELEDRIATEIALTIVQNSPLYADVMQRPEEGMIPVVEQLKARVRFFLRSKADAADPRLKDDASWSERQLHRIDHISNILFDRGPERIRHVDGYISKLNAIISQSKKPAGFAKLISETKLPGATDILRLYDKKLAPVEQGSADSKDASRELETHIHFLVSRIEARKFVLERMRSDLQARSELGADSMERAAKFWSGDVMLSLDGGDLVPVGVDDARFFETYARLAQEEVEEEQELARLVKTGRTMIMRSFKVDSGSGRLLIPNALKDTFVADALNKPLSASQAMVNAYRREINNYMKDSDSAEFVSQQLSAINARISEIKPTLNIAGDASSYHTQAEYAYSPHQHGPVFRISLYNSKSGSRIGTAEYPGSIPRGDIPDDELSRNIANWFSGEQPGSLELAARVAHAQLKSKVEQLALSATKDSALGPELTLKLSGSSPVSRSTIDTITRVMTASAILERQSIRLYSVKKDPLTLQQLDIFKIPDGLQDTSAPLEDFLRDAPLRAEGISEIETAIPQVRSLLAEYEVFLDVARKKIVVKAPRNLSQGAVRDRIIELDTASLYDIATMKEMILEKLAQTVT